VGRMREEVTNRKRLLFIKKYNYFVEI